MAKTVQTDFFGKPRMLWYCTHCKYVGYEFVKEGEFEVCPECGWCCYSDTEVKEGFLHSNIYPKLVEKYCKVHKIPNPIEEFKKLRIKTLNQQIEDFKRRKTNTSFFEMI